MDTRKFDAFAKTLATGTSRRSVIGGLFGGALAMAGLSHAAGAPKARQDICHRDGKTGRFRVISVSGKALDLHIAHGDFPAVGGTCVEGVTCPEPASGSGYVDTCPYNGREMTCTDGVTTLSASCQTEDYEYNDTSIIVNSCKEQGYIVNNCNGTLTCGSC